MGVWENSQFSIIYGFVYFYVTLFVNVYTKKLKKEAELIDC